MQQEGAANMMARRKGQTMQDKRVTERRTMQGDQVGEDTTRGERQRTQRAAVGWQMTQQEGGMDNAGG